MVTDSETIGHLKFYWREKNQIIECKLSEKSCDSNSAIAIGRLVAMHVAAHALVWRRNLHEPLWRVSYCDVIFGAPLTCTKVSDVCTPLVARKSRPIIYTGCVQSNPVIPPTLSCFWWYNGVGDITGFHNLTWSTYINTFWLLKRHKAISSATYRPIDYE